MKLSFWLSTTKSTDHFYHIIQNGGGCGLKGFAFYTKTDVCDLTATGLFYIGVDGTTYAHQGATPL